MMSYVSQLQQLPSGLAYEWVIMMKAMKISRKVQCMISLPQGCVEYWLAPMKEGQCNSQSFMKVLRAIDCTTRKHRYSDDKYRRYVLGITVFRGHTDENGSRKFFVGKTIRRYLLRYFRWNGPRKHSERKEVSEYSDELWPSEYSEKPLPSEYSEEVYPSGYSEEICPQNISRNYGRRNIPRNHCRRNIPRKYEMLPTVLRKFRRNTDGNGSFLGISSEFLKSPTAIIYPRIFVGVFRGICLPRYFICIFRGNSSEYSEDLIFRQNVRQNYDVFL
ncbi:hypothetical protein DY000_02030320 [Brassica cretica]|uniref:Uncharacterized protein n=1 Tax=Brassica cretica TaxID=69181 RepID=A0ABQ7DHZ9_BRACR|nr:hypothetical protein DY000_02030320 [Brassica cretica]